MNKISFWGSGLQPKFLDMQRMQRILINIS